MGDNEDETYQELSLDSSEGEDDESSRSLPRNFRPTGYIDLDNIETATMDNQIPNSNIGYKMLLRMGWRAGTGLGSTGQGRIEPVRIEMKQDVLGIGKAEEEASVHIETTKKRKVLESEKIEAETDEKRLKREILVKQMEATKKEVESMNKTFYCELCDKQYTRITEFETHLSSYDHNHKKRFREMQQSAKPITSQAERDKKREKERKREEKEMKILQEAAAKRAGVQTVAVQSTSVASVATAIPEGGQNSTSKQGAMSFGFAKKEKLTPTFKITMKK